LGRGTLLMALFLQFLAVLSILFLLYFHVLHEKQPRQRRHSSLAVASHGSGRPSVTRSEWKKGLY
jgi:hypothetical protein